MSNDCCLGIRDAGREQPPRRAIQTMGTLVIDKRESAVLLPGWNGVRIGNTGWKNRGKRVETRPCTRKGVPCIQ